MIMRILCVFLCSPVWVLQTSVSATEFPPTVPKTLRYLTILPAMVKDLSAEERGLVEEYRRHYLRVLDLYRNIKIVAEQKHYRRDGLQYSLLTYWSNGGHHLRMDDESLCPLVLRSRIRVLRQMRRLSFVRQRRTWRHWRR